MSIHSDVKEEIKEAARLRDRERATALKSLIAEFTNEAIKKGKDRDSDLPDESALEVINRLVKQRRDSIEQFEKGGREDLAETERLELSVLEKYLPEQMTEKEVKEYIEKKMKEMKISDRGQIGPLLGAVMKELKGYADGRVVKRVTEELLPEEK
ncbi:MAG: GatB/YqeY domain-containing protein [Patescibacteria group bacterium]